MALLYSNNAKSLLVADMATTGNTVVIRASDANLFPDIDTPGDWYPLAITDPTGAVEYLRCVGKAINVLTVQRGREGSQPRAHGIGAVVDLRLTAAALGELTDSLIGELAELQDEFDRYRNTNDEALQDIRQRIEAITNDRFEDRGGTIKGPVTITGSLTVDDATVLKKGVAVTGNGTISENLTVRGNLTVDGETTLKALTAAATKLASLGVDGETTVQALKAVSLALNGVDMAFPVTSNSNGTAIRLPGNILIQWGKLTSITNNFMAGTYVLPFGALPTLTFAPVRSASSNPDKFKAVVNTETARDFSVELRGFGPTSCNWLAVGRGVEA